MLEWVQSKAPVLPTRLINVSPDLLCHQALQEQLTSAVQEIGHLIDPVSTAARGEAAQLGHKVISDPETPPKGGLTK